MAQNIKAESLDKEILMGYDKVQLWTDGGSRGNPGHAAIGVVLKSTSGETLWQQGRYLGTPISNNQAEYQAFLAGLHKAQEIGAGQIEAFLDSQLVVEQINGRFKVKEPGLQEWWRKAQEVLRQFSGWKVSYVPRAENKVADGLVNQALDEELQNG